MFQKFRLQFNQSFPSLIHETISLRLFLWYMYPLQQCLTKCPDKLEPCPSDIWSQRILDLGLLFVQISRNFFLGLRHAIYERRHKDTACEISRTWKQSVFVPLAADVSDSRQYEFGCGLHPVTAWFLPGANIILGIISWFQWLFPGNLLSLLWTTVNFSSFCFLVELFTLCDLKFF